MLAVSVLVALAATPTVVAEDLQFHRTRVATGITMHYATSGPVNGRPVVMLHGLTDSWQSFELLMPLLPEGTRAIAVDLRGHGRSDAPATGYGMHEMAADVVALMEALGLRDAVVVGHSMGSFVAREVARQAGERVAGLVVIGTAALAGNEAVRGLATEVDGMGDAIPTEFIVAFQQSTVTVQPPAAFMDRVVAASRGVAPHVWRGALRGMLTQPVASRSTVPVVPTLVMAGDQDGVFSVAEHRALAEVSRSTGVQVYAGIGHAPHWEAPARVAADLARFLRELDSQRPGARER